ncbi:MAG: histidinol-phosphatase HisJ family protein [Ruminococcaceae bacterium]|nr:histidinol-phosphatase HisJ family protein [Oscillospiraceae bacterium]
MIKRDFHVHTTFSDGKCTPEELAELALSLGMTHLGFSDHSYTPFDPDYCMSPEAEAEYKREISRLKEKYRPRIEIFCGIEQDYYSKKRAEGYDYIIGSVHYVKAGGEYLSVDKSAADLRAAVNEHFAGDPLAFAEEYFRTVGEVVDKTCADIIGHFDLLTKFNEKDPLIDESHPRYIKAWQSAVDRLLPTGKLFEINTGVIARGYRSAPYPASPIIEYIKKGGGSFILSSDSHRPTLCFGFEDVKL